MKPASLAEERIRGLRDRCEYMLTRGIPVHDRERAETTLALLAEREEMLRLLESALDNMPPHTTAHDAIVDFLATRTAGKETG
jgi:hypothetical protein